MWMNGKQQHRLLALLTGGFGTAAAQWPARRRDGWPAGSAVTGNRRVKGPVLS
jgi:hypothetical protein